MMNYLKNWNPINTVENILIFIAAIVLMNWFVVKPLNQKLERMENVLFELAQQPKYQIENDFGKMKAKDGQVVLDLNNTMNTQNLETIPNDTIQETERNFWDKLFGRNKQ